MSHFTTVKVDMGNMSALEAALRDMKASLTSKSNNRLQYSVHGEKFSFTMNKAGTMDCYYDEGTGGRTLNKIKQYYTKHVSIAQLTGRGFMMMGEHKQGGNLVLDFNNGKGESVIVTIKDNGVAEIDTHGFKGVGCRDATASLESQLGTVQSRTVKDHRERIPIDRR